MTEWQWGCRVESIRGAPPPEELNTNRYDSAEGELQACPGPAVCNVDKRRPSIHRKKKTKTTQVVEHSQLGTRKAQKHTGHWARRGFFLFTTSQTDRSRNAFRVRRVKAWFTSKSSLMNRLSRREIAETKSNLWHGQNIRLLERSDSQSTHRVCSTQLQRVSSFKCFTNNFSQQDV